MSDQTPYKVNLKDINGNPVYPNTVSGAVYVGESVNLNSKLSEIDSGIEDLNDNVSRIDGTIASMPYAGSPSHGGPASSAMALTGAGSDKGSATMPVYFKAGTPFPCNMRMYDVKIPAHSNLTVSIKSGIACVGKKGVGVTDVTTPLSVYLDGFGGVMNISAPAQPYCTVELYGGGAGTYGTHQYKVTNNSGVEVVLFVACTIDQE